MKRSLLAILLLLAACAPEPSGNSTGAQIFATNCAACHGADLSGGIGLPLGPGSNAASQSDEYLIHTITFGRGSRMPSFQSTLTQDQISDVVSYIREVQSG